MKLTFILTNLLLIGLLDIDYFWKAMWFYILLVYVFRLTSNYIDSIKN